MANPYARINTLTELDLAYARDLQELEEDAIEDFEHTGFSADTSAATDILAVYCGERRRQLQK